MTKVTDAMQQVLEYQYNQDDTLHKILYPNGETEEYAYDGQNHTKWYKDRASVIQTTSYTPSGNIAAVSDSVGNKDYQYDSFGRLTQVKDTIGRITSYT